MGIHDTAFYLYQTGFEPAATGLTHFAALTLETNKKRSKSGYFHTKAEPFLCFYFASS